MSQNKNLTTSQVNLVFGAGITRALVANLGVLKAAQNLRIKIASIGGISAGAVLPLLFAAGVSVDEMDRIVMSHNIGDFFDKNSKYLHWPALIWKVLNRRRYQRVLPPRGAFGTARLGEFIDGLVSVWPDNYWTMAFSPGDDAQVAFCKRGIFMRYRSGQIEQIDTVPAPLGLAIRATCAIPGIFDRVDYVTSNGRKLELFDGFLSWDGYCPAAFVEQFIGVAREEIIACDVIKYKTPNRLFGKGYRAVLTPNPPFPVFVLHPTARQKRIGVARAFSKARRDFASVFN